VNPRLRPRGRLIQERLDLLHMTQPFLSFWTWRTVIDPFHAVDS
jgi:hypothetical protein